MAGLEQALDELERRARELDRSARRDPVDVKVRQFEPEQLVAARLELAGPQRFLPSEHAGLDIRGDGSVVAYRGQVKKETIEPLAGEDAVDALRRVLADRS